MASPYSTIHWGTFTKQFEHRKPEYKHIKNLHNFAKYILKNPDKFNNVTIRRARFYKNLIQHHKIHGGSVSSNALKKFVDNSYKHDKKEIDEFNLDTDISTNEVQVYFDEKRIIIVFTGTHDAKDWFNNVSLAIGRYTTTKRFKDAQHVFNEALAKYPDKIITLIGHSQSGMIAHLLDLDKVFEVIEYNPALFPTTRFKENEYVVKTSHDPISIGFKPNHNAVILPSTTINPLREHSTVPLEHLNKVFGKNMIYLAKI